MSDMRRGAEKVVVAFHSFVRQLGGYTGCNLAVMFFLGVLAASRVLDLVRYMYSKHSIDFLLC